MPVRDEVRVRRRWHFSQRCQEPQPGSSSARTIARVHSGQRQFRISYGPIGLVVVYLTFVDTHLVGTVNVGLAGPGTNVIVLGP